MTPMNILRIATSSLVLLFNGGCYSNPHKCPEPDLTTQPVEHYGPTVPVQEGDVNLSWWPETSDTIVRVWDADMNLVAYEQIILDSNVITVLPAGCYTWELSGDGVSCADPAHFEDSGLRLEVVSTDDTGQLESGEFTCVWDE